MGREEGGGKPCKRKREGRGGRREGRVSFNGFSNIIPPTPCDVPKSICAKQVCWEGEKREEEGRREEGGSHQRGKRGKGREERGRAEAPNPCDAPKLICAEQVGKRRGEGAMREERGREEEGKLRTKG
jgi:hypothetical protein